MRRWITRWSQQLHMIGNVGAIAPIIAALIPALGCETAADGVVVTCREGLLTASQVLWVSGTFTGLKILLTFYRDGPKAALLGHQVPAKMD